MSIDQNDRRRFALRRPAPEPVEPDPVDVACSGDPQAVAELFRDLDGPLVRYLSAHDPMHADEIAGEVWMTVAGEMSTLVGGLAGVRRRLFALAAERVESTRPPLLTRRREHLPSRYLAFPPSAAEPTPPLRNDLSGQAAADVIAILAPRQEADVMLLRSIADVSLVEVARILAIAPTEAATAQDRALRLLVDRFGANGVERLLFALRGGYDLAERTGSEVDALLAEITTVLQTPADAGSTGRPIVRRLLMAAAAVALVSLAGVVLLVRRGSDGGGSVATATTVAAKRPVVTAGVEPSSTVAVAQLGNGALVSSMGPPLPGATATTAAAPAATSADSAFPTIVPTVPDTTVLAVASAAPVPAGSAAHPSAKALCSAWAHAVAAGAAVDSTTRSMLEAAAGAKGIAGFCAWLGITPSAPGTTVSAVAPDTTVSSEVMAAVPITAAASEPPATAPTGTVATADGSPVPVTTAAHATTTAGSPVTTDPPVTHTPTTTKSTTTSSSTTTTSTTTTTDPPPVTTDPPPVTTDPPPVTTDPPPVTTDPPPVTTDPPPVTTDPAPPVTG